MINRSQSEAVAKIGNWVVERITKIEIPLFAIALIAYLLKGSVESNALSPVMIAALGILGMLYYFVPFARLEDPNAGMIEGFALRLSYWATSIAVLSVLFILNHYPGSGYMSIAGMLTLLLSIPTLMILKKRKPELKVISGKEILRFLIWLGILSILAFSRGVVPPKLG